jgi:hypothetical protein
MRFSIIAAALPLALAAALVSTSARADGAFITLKDGAGQLIGTRAPVATFTAGTLQSYPIDPRHPADPLGAGGYYSPSTFEIDGATNMPDYLQKVGATFGTVTVEFTTPNASGQEVVTSVGTFSGAMLKTAGASFDASGLRGLYSFDFGGVAYTTASNADPATAQRAVAVAAPRKLTGSLPVLTRSNSRHPTAVAGAPIVDAAYLALTPAPGSPLPAVQTGALKTAAFSVELVVMGGQAGPLTIGAAPTVSIYGRPLTITRTHATTPTFQQSISTRGSWPTGTLSFVHTNADGTTTPVVHFTLLVASVRTDQAAVSGGVSTETTTIAYGSVNGYSDLPK